VSSKSKDQPGKKKRLRNNIFACGVRGALNTLREVIGDLTVERGGYDNLVVRLAGVMIGEYAVENPLIGNSE